MHVKVASCVQPQTASINMILNIRDKKEETYGTFFSITSVICLYLNIWKENYLKTLEIQINYDF